MFDAFQKRVDERVDEKLKIEYAKLEIKDKNVDRWINILAVTATMFTIIIPSLTIWAMKRQFSEKLAEVKEISDEIKIKKDEIDSYCTSINEQKKEIEEDLLEPIKRRLFVAANTSMDLTKDEFKKLEDIAQKPFPSVEMILTVSALLNAHNLNFNDSFAYFFQLYALNPDSKQYVWFCAVTLSGLGRYREAKSLVASALGKTIPWSDEFIVLRVLLAEISMKKGEHAEALKNAEELHERCKNGDINDRNLMIAILSLMGFLKLIKGENDSALVYYTKAAKIIEQEEDHKSFVESRIYNNMGWCYLNNENITNALDCFGRALAISKELLSSEHPNMATNYNNIARVYRVQDNYVEALKYYKKSIAILEKFPNSEEFCIMSSYRDIADVYYSQKNGKEALTYYEKALEICEKVLGTEHPDTAQSYHNIAYVNDALGNYPEALDACKKAVDIYERVLGCQHERTLCSKDLLKKIEQKIAELGLPKEGE